MQNLFTKRHYSNNVISLNGIYVQNDNREYLLKTNIDEIHQRNIFPIISESPGRHSWRTPPLTKQELGGKWKPTQS